MTIETNFLNYAAEKLTQLSGRIETCLGKLTPDQIWARSSENQNAVDRAPVSAWNTPALSPTLPRSGRCPLDGTITRAPTPTKS